MLLMSTPMWLLFMSWNSGLSMVSSSTAKMLLSALPLSVTLRMPRYWPALKVESRVLGATTNAMPLSLSTVKLDTMAKTNAAEKDWTAPPAAPPRRRIGVGWNACPAIWFVPLLSTRRPLGATAAMPSSVRLAPPKPL
ncbi:Os04g0531600 [Oryza sativa Japonica Group]|uniref:Os04g0531600 protein n=2 Tax=Oryza sativa subsp. japonica TaxID=39947 RepID=Q0JBH5_ORYSJ|nr:hypothetical protein EE612_024578 [Oryza sativa]BAF15312.1 Os04g0531600 [Oryza sativa Japonica Group]BAS90218.1 Os04g0531600 [Oryza sativa Japonica Group]|eukprot:NP_001053398.1 Os04g0531600 [Oryza sativa Japonica Group]